MAKVRKHDKNLEKFLIDFDRLHVSIKKELGGLDGNLTALQKIVNRHIRSSIQDVLLLIEQYNKSHPPSRETVEDIQVKLQRITGEVENTIEYERLVK